MYIHSIIWNIIKNIIHIYFFIYHCLYRETLQQDNYIVLILLKLTITIKYKHT